jgi:hypothetical protein
LATRRRLRDEGVQVKHILGDGRLEDHEQALKRLVTMLRIPSADMFRPDATVIEDAYLKEKWGDVEIEHL